MSPLSYLARQMGTPQIRLQDAWLRWVGMPVLSVLYTTVVNLKSVLEEGRPWWKQYLTDFVFVAICWTIARWVIRFARRRYPGLHETFPRVMLLVGSMVVVSVVEGFFVISILNYTQHFHVRFTTADFLYTSGLILVFSLMIVSVYELLYSLSAWKRLAVETEALKRENLLSQLESLKEQVKPHFLFNSLSTLIGLIDEDRDRAKTFVEELAYVYRYLLQSSEQVLIPLADELAFIRAYYFLLKTRFEDRLHLDIRVSEEAGRQLLPPLTLQLLIENAVKHNQVSADSPLSISICDEGPDRIVVTNTLRRKLSAIPSTGKGIAHLTTKYTLLRHPPPQLRETEDEFIVIVHLIPPAFV